MEEFPPWFVYAFIGVGPEIVTLGLKQVCRQPGASQAVKIAKRGRQAGHWYAMTCSKGYYIPQVSLGSVDPLTEIGGKKQVL